MVNVTELCRSPTFLAKILQLVSMQNYTNLHLVTGITILKIQFNVYYAHFVS